MRTKAEEKQDVISKDLRPKQILWLRHYLDDSNSETFMNATKSAMAAGYTGKDTNSFSCIGRKNYRKLRKQIAEYLVKEGFTTQRVSEKIRQLMEAQYEEDGKFKPVHSVQVQATKLATKVLGMESAEKHEISGPGGSPIDVRIAADMDPKAAAEAYEDMIRRGKKK